VRGGIVPATGQERSLINIHAWNLRDALGVKAAQLGFSPKQWQEAISNTAKEYVPNNY